VVLSHPSGAFEGILNLIGLNMIDPLLGIFSGKDILKKVFV
jgi:hypothetical protein